MTRTALICTITMIVLGTYDAVAVLFGGIPNSISRWLADTGCASPCFVFAFGFIAGHVFGFMRLSLESALLGLRSLPKGWDVEIIADGSTIKVNLSDGTRIVESQSLPKIDIDALVRTAIQQEQSHASHAS